jgi:hypothetical protein
MKKTKWIPFGMLPASWGLRGKSREIAEAEYYLSGEELDRRLAEINFADNELELKKAQLSIDVKYQKITQLEADEAIIRLTQQNKQEQELAILNLKFRNGIINQNEFDRSSAEILEQPWVGVKTTEFDPSKGINGFSLELDYNEYFVDMLRRNGYKGANSQQIVEQWFNDLATSIAYEEGITAEDIEILNPSPSASRRVSKLGGIGNRDIYS